MEFFILIVIYAEFYKIEKRVNLVSIVGIVSLNKFTQYVNK
jgi:hypothetical protein